MEQENNLEQKGKGFFNIFKKMKEYVEPKLSPIEKKIKEIIIFYLNKEETIIYHVGEVYMMKTDKFTIELVYTNDSRIFATFRTSSSRVEVRFDSLTSVNIIESFNNEVEKRINDLNDTFDEAIIRNLSQYLLSEDETK
jgi:ribosome-associated translation inhibitor RaiA